MLLVIMNVVEFCLKNQAHIFVFLVSVHFFDGEYSSVYQLYFILVELKSTTSHIFSYIYFFLGGILYCLFTNHSYFYIHLSKYVLLRELLYHVSSEWVLGFE